MAQSKKVQGVFSWVVIASEIGHVFCCVLPTVFSVLTLLVGMGMIGVMPIWIDQFHDVMHGWEIPLMGFSGGVLLTGWAIYYVSRRMDCHDTGCCHEPCSPKKDRTKTILKIATALFVINVMIYATVHVPQSLGYFSSAHDSSKHETHAHD